MARPIWKGMISFGLVSVPVALHSAGDSHQLAFSMLDKRDFSPVGYKRYNKKTGKEVPWKDIVKGYEYEKDRYVVLSDEDFRRANVQHSKSVEIATFVAAGSIPPQYFETPYYLVPDERGQKVYALLRETLRTTGKVGIGQVVIRTTHHLAAVVPIDDVLMMITMRYANEIREHKSFDLPPLSLKSAGVTAKELERARKLIEDMAGPWNPEAFEDTYNEDLMHRIEEKVERGETKVLTKPEGEKAERRSAQVIDLSRLSRVRVSAGGPTPVGGGAPNAGLLDASLGGRWLVPAGTCLSVGVGGLVQGGGIGYHSRWAGLTSDRLRSAQVVTAAGEVVTASADEHPELFWALRGGTGGTFGVCTELEFDAAPVPSDDIVYYRFTWTGADAALAMLVALDEIHQTAPAEFVASAGVQATPIGSNGPDAAMDVFVRGQFLGSEDDFMAIVAPLLAAAPPVTQDIRVEPFWEVAPRFTNPESENHSWGDISRYADAPLPESALERVVELIADAPSR